MSRLTEEQRDYFPPHMYRWSDSGMQYFLSQLPFHESRLRDGDDLGRNTRLLARLDDRELLMVGSYVYWAHFHGEAVISLTFLSGLAARDAIVEHAWALPDDVRNSLIQAFQPGVDWDRIRRKTITPALGNARLIEDRPLDGGRRQQLFVFGHSLPSSSAALSVEIESDGTVASFGVHEGRDGYERMVEALFRTGDWPA